MEYTLLPGTDTMVSRLAFGCEPLGGTDWGDVDVNSAMRAVSKALDLGVNVFDTADVYGLGRSERLLSKALGRYRHEVVIASKFGVNWLEDSSGQRAETFLDSSPRRVVEALEDSLRRLRVETIPLYFIHWPDPDTPISDTMEALLECKEQGKIRHIGLSNFALSQICEANEIAEIKALQVQYNLTDRKVEHSVLPGCFDMRIGIFAYGTLAQGLLTGKYGLKAEFGADDRRRRLPNFQPGRLAENLKIVERLKLIGQRYNKTAAQVAIRWALDHQAVTSAIVGAKSSRQIEQNVGALGWRLSAEEYEYIAGDSSMSDSERK
jgi:aryl-alcohol dehydrogenase-like predicted oxidoreductase